MRREAAAGEKRKSEDCQGIQFSVSGSGGYLRDDQLYDGRNSQLVLVCSGRMCLKNEMWQLLILSGIAILWDRFTGWRGWSVDFVLPFGALAVQFSVPVIARVNRLEREEYLFYLVQAGVAGLIPLILIWTGIVGFVYPSVICVGISILTLAALFIFCRKDTVREFHKKLRM